MLLIKCYNNLSTFSVTVTLRFLKVEKPEEQSVSVGELGHEWVSRPAFPEAPPSDEAITTSVSSRAYELIPELPPITEFEAPFCLFTLYFFTLDVEVPFPAPLSDDFPTLSPD